jgi:hypothetical protein
MARIDMGLENSLTMPGKKLLVNTLRGFQEKGRSPDSLVFPPKHSKLYALSSNPITQKEAKIYTYYMNILRGGGDSKLCNMLNFILTISTFFFN